MENKMLTPAEQMTWMANANYYRGSVINTFTSLERTIEMILNLYFLGNEIHEKQSDFSFIILDRMTFEAKRTSIKALNEKHQINKGFVKTKNNSYPNSQVFEEIRLLQDQRNYFAHFSIIMEKQQTDSVIKLIELRDKSNEIIYSKDDITGLNKRINKAINALKKLFFYDAGALLHGKNPDFT